MGLLQRKNVVTTNPAPAGFFNGEKMKLIDNAPQLWKMWSVRIMAAMAVGASVWDQIPPDVKSLIPQNWLPYIVSGASVLGIIARAVKQFDKK